MAAAGTHAPGVRLNSCDETPLLLIWNVAPLFLTYDETPLLRIRYPPAFLEGGQAPFDTHLVLYPRLQ